MQASGAPSRRYVVVDGNIGSGKTTLLQRLAALGLHVIPEPVERWCAPFRHRGEAVDAPLDLYYRDRHRHALGFQVHVLTTRIQQLLSGDAAQGVVVLERDPFDTALFAEYKLQSGVFDAFQHRCFTELVNTVSQALNFECVGRVYLRASPELCMARVRARGRPSEAGLDAATLAPLHALHEAKYAGERAPGTLEVDAAGDVADAAREVVAFVRRCSDASSYSSS